MRVEEVSGTSLPELGLRESKKRAARLALSWAAMRLATERGLDQLRVEDIASEAGVSTRTFNNYFSSKEEAICAFNIERQEHLREILLARPAEEPPWTAVINAVTDQHSATNQPSREHIQRIRLLVQHPSLQGEFLKSHAQMETVLAEAIAKRTGIDPASPDDITDYLQVRLMAGAVITGTRIAMHQWLRNETEEFVPILVKLLHELAGGFPILNTRFHRFSTSQANKQFASDRS